MNKISVILCVYKNDTLEQFKEMFESLENQTYKKFDVFVQQDGLINVLLESYLDTLKELGKIIYIGKRSENMGFAYSLNEIINIVIEKEQYDYIVRMDSDDICMLNRIEVQYNFMEEKTEVDVCGAWIEEFNTDDMTKQVIKYPKNHNEHVNCPVLRFSSKAHYTSHVAERLCYTNIL